MKTRKLLSIVLALVLAFALCATALADEDDVLPAPSINAVTADTVIVDPTTQTEVEANVVYEGEGGLTSIRLYVRCDIAVKKITSTNNFEYNPENDMIVVFKDDGTPVDTALFTIVFDLSAGYEDGEYPIDLELVQATNNVPEFLEVEPMDGVIIIETPYTGPVKGDVDQDGDVDNADVIMVARYLVELEEFDEVQMEIADFDDSGEIDNLDLILIVRYIITH